MKQREAYYDNAKFFLILFVVFGHFIQSYIHDDIFIYTLYTTIYTFHMPAFILISGFFAKGFQKKGYLMKLIKKLLLPYLIFQGIYSVYYFFLMDKGLAELNPLHPQWSLWFLLSLFCWNVMLYLFAKWKAAISLTIAFTIGIIVGYVDEINSFLSLSRTFVFFPFFLLGYFLKKEHFEKVQRKVFKHISMFVMSAVFVAFYVFPQFEYQWFFGSKPYEVLGQPGLEAGLIRLGVYGVTVLMTLSFLALVPRKPMFYTKWGTHSLYVYLLHGFFIKYFRSSEVKELLQPSEQVLVLLVVSFMLTGLLASKWIRKLAQPIIEMKRLFS